MSFNIFEAFKYRRKKTFIHSLDPRTKLALALGVSALSIIFTELIVLLIIFLSLVPLLLIAKSIKEWTSTVKGLTLLIVFILFVNIIFNGLSFAISMVLRIFSLITAFSLFFLTVHPDELSQALIQMKIPFSFAFAMSMAIRYVPTIANEAQTIREAQMSRGLELEKGGFTQRIKNFIPIIIPLIVSSIRRAISIAESLESRGFGAYPNRTYLLPLKMRKRDYTVLITLLAAIIISVIIKFVVGLPPLLLLSIPF